MYRHGETDVRPPDEELLVYFKQFQIGFEYPCYYQADDMARVTFDRPETDDDAVLSIFAVSRRPLGGAADASSHAPPSPPRSSSPSLSCSSMRCTGSSRTRRCTPARSPCCWTRR